MSDQQAPPNGDSPAVAGPAEAPGTAQDQQSQSTPGQAVDWEQRYKDTQADYTRQQQENAELKQYRDWAQVALTSNDPDTLRQAYEVLGIEVDDESERGYDDGFEEFTDEDDPVESLRAELNELREWRDSLTQQEQQAAETEFVTNWSHEQLDELGVTDPETKQWIFERALSMPHLKPQPGMPTNWLPDLKSAHEQYRVWADNQMRTWAKTKQAPYVPSGGLPANEVPDPGHGHEARMSRAMQSLRNNMGDEQ